MKKPTLHLAAEPGAHSTAKPPEGLSDAALSWWKALQSEYGIRDSYGLLLLREVVTNFDRAERAKVLVVKHGEVIEHDGKLSRNPACSVEAAARHAMLLAAKALNIDLTPLHDRPGRPTSNRSY